MLMTVLLFFGGLAAVLAALGVYGLFSWMVALRRRELAIRLTLGARPSSIGMLVLGAAAPGRSLAACLPGARRAMRVDPVEGLRAE